jgi:hypothetical protein
MTSSNVLSRVVRMDPWNFRFRGDCTGVKMPGDEPGVGSGCRAVYVFLAQC